MGLDVANFPAPKGELYHHHKPLAPWALLIVVYANKDSIAYN
jgi:hypothetical protein